MRIQIENLTFHYKSPWSGPKKVLNNISFAIEPGEMLALAGPSGSGKTTLMQHLTGLLGPDSGRILVDGHDIWQDTSLAKLRRRIGLVFQFPETQLFGETVFEDIAFGPRNLGMTEPEVHRRAKTALEQVGLSFQNFSNRSPLRLSEGERRRVALAGILAMQPECLALDEPTAGLDAAGISLVMDIIKQFHAKGRTVIIVSHDIETVCALVERLIILKDGAVLFDGDKEDLFRDDALLEAAGLEVPRARKVADRLMQMGLVKTNRLYSLSEIESALGRSPVA